MRETNVLGLKVAGITAVLLLVLFGLYWGGRALLLRDGKDKSIDEQAGMSLADRTRDSDKDGVADLYETIYYQTDPNNPDTDGDGTSDLDEIISGRDPRVPGPNDESKPATGSRVTEVKTYTQQYFAGLPDNVPRNEILNQVRLESFVSNNRGALLPVVTQEMIKTVPGEGKGAVTAYLDNISSTHNEALKGITSADIEAAFRLQTTSQELQPMQDIVAALNSNLEIIKGVTAPTEVAGLHMDLIAASQALRDNVALLSKIKLDFVGGLIAAKNIEDLGDEFQKIARDIETLEEKYGID